MSEAEAYLEVQDEQEKGPLYRAAKGGCAEVEAERLISTFNRSLCQILDAYDYFEKGSGLNTEDKIARLALFTAEEKMAMGADCTGVVSSGRLILISTTLRAGLRFPFTSRSKLERFALHSLREALEWHNKHSELPQNAENSGVA